MRQNANRGNQAGGAIVHQDIVSREDQKKDGADTHGCHHGRVCLGQEPNSPDIDDRDSSSKQQHPDNIGDGGYETLSSQSRVDHALQRDQKIIQDHGPACYKADRRTKRLLDVGIGRTR